MIIIGHRGAPVLEPENTLLGIERAIEIGVDAVEIDVHLTGDDELVVIHDSTVDRTTNGTGPVNNYALEEIQKLDAGRGQTIPTLEEVVERVDGRVGLIIELKAPGTEKKVLELIRKHSLQETAYVISFWHKLVKAIKDQDPRIKTGVLLVGCPVDCCIATGASADALVMNYGFIDREFVAVAHDEGLQVMIWNIDDPKLISPYEQMGVDGIGSNDPAILADYFK